jgi:hypothetical protein
MLYKSNDLIVWNGIITYYAIIKPLLSSSDSIAFAQHEDILLYNSFV